MNYHIRKLGVTDGPLLKALNIELAEKEAWIARTQKFDGMTDEDWIKRLNGEIGYSFALIHNDEPVGMLMLRRYDEHPDVAMLMKAYVRKSHRGIGYLYAGHVLRLMANEAKLLGFDKIGFSHRRKNKFIGLLAKRHGFKPIEEIELDFADGERDRRITWVKSLS